MRQNFSVAAIHDMSGYGKCSLTVAIPVISAAGIKVCPLPTAVLSTNTAYQGFVFHELTGFMRQSLEHWQSLQLKFDAIYSGFLGSAEQIDIVIDMIGKFPVPLVVVDPVLGDKGKPYATMTTDICRKMLDLAICADVITPNITEACLLTESTYRSEEISREEAYQLCHRLQEKGCRNIVLTGVQQGSELLNYVLQTDGDFYANSIEKVGVMRHGTGDLFASVLTAGLVRGFSMRDASASASAFVHDSLELSREDETREGACFEPILYKLTSGIYQK
ncbi:MAG: pyridoxamine kinase [Firmicutes bacterium]|nr:pyridoxamine kinase [Bacillota bacterium]